MRSTIGRPPERANAWRNERAVLDAAAAVFTASDVNAPVRDIAAAAGVGMGTIDRHFGATMTGDGVMVLADGSVVTRDEVVAALAEAPSWASYEMDQIRVVATGDGSAALVYVGTAHREGDAPAFVGVMTSVYVRVGDRWKLAIYQQTPKP